MGAVDFLFVDSGTGGLPYMLKLKEKSPQSRCVYVGDTKNFPYGEKSLKEIEHMASQTVALALERFHPEVVVIACNTMSVAALEMLRGTFSVPFIGTVPAIKLASSVSIQRKIGLLATRHTVEDPYTDDLINRFASDCTVVKRGDSDLVSFIEHHLFTATYEQRCNACLPAVEFFKANGTDTIVLACTHFIHLLKEFEQVAGSDIRVIDSRDGVARQALRVFESSGFQVSLEEISDVLDQAVYVTGLHSKSDEDEYRSWCALSGVPFMGILQ